MSNVSATPNIANKKLEQIVLGAILLNEENYWGVSDLLTMDMFAFEDHQKIFAIMYELANDGRAIRVPVVAGRIGSLSDNQDADAYTSMLLHVASKEDGLPLRDYAFELRESATRRKVLAVAEGMLKTASDVKYDAQQIVDRAVERLSDISRSAAIEHESTLSSVFQQITETDRKRAGGAALRPCLIGLEEMIGTFRPGSLVLWGGAPGSGKRLCINTPIPTPDGFKAMGQLQVGDQVFSQDGTVTKVTGVSPILMAERSFAVRFNTGEEILADGDHLWKTMTKAERTAVLRRTDEARASRRANRPSRAVENSKKPWTTDVLMKRNAEMAHEYLLPPTGSVRNTNEILETLRVGVHANHSIDVCGAVNLPDAELPIEPYLLGLWLGDGASSKGSIGMSSADWEQILPLVGRPVKSSREETAGQHNRKTDYKDISFEGLYLDLKSAGLLKNKHIPLAYLRASKEQRLALLQGLMDTDGTCCARSGQATLSLSDKQLIGDAHELICSLGMKGTIITRPTEKKDRHDVKFTAHLPVFQLQRKLDRLVKVKGRPVTRRRYIVEITPVEPRLMRCIAVEHPDRTYLVGRSFIATHNTAIAMQQMLYSSTVHPTTLFELEMADEDLVVRSTSGQTGVTMRAMSNGLTEDNYRALIKAKADYANRKMTIVSPAKMTIQQIRSRAFAHKRKFGLDLVAVDHIKLVERPSKVRMDPVERAYENARDLKALAKDLNCVVIGLCQFTKAARQKEQPEPEMEDFYGGSLEEHADLMLANFNRNGWHHRNPPPTQTGKVYENWLTAKNETAGKIEVFKLKDRFGPPRDRKIFDWDGAATLFKDQHSQVSMFDDTRELV